MCEDLILRYCSLHVYDINPIQINELGKDERRETIVDKVYKAAIKEFHVFVITAKASQVRYTDSIFHERRQFFGWNVSDDFIKNTSDWKINLFCLGPNSTIPI